MPMIAYVVRPGDHLAKLAFTRGFDADLVWNDPANDELRARRPNPQILSPGDVLFVPSREPPADLRVRRGRTNAFRGTVPTGTLRIRFGRGTGDQRVALANEPFRVEGVPGPPIEGTTDADGLLSVTVPVDAGAAVVVFTRTGARWPVRIGHLDPIDAPSGVRARLLHLGYLHGFTNGADDLPRALRAFQHDNGLPRTGALDDATRDRLVERHGV